MPYVKDQYGNWKWQDAIGGSPEDQAQRQFTNAGQDFISGGPAEYKWNGDVSYNQLGATPQVGQTGLKEVTTDPRLLDAQMKALTAMEEQGNTGLSAADELALNQSSKKQAADARSRQMTIEQDLARKGRSGGRLGITMQQQASQAAQEAAANDAAQRNVMAQEGRLQAKMGAANLAGNISNEEYQRKANAAQAQDAIAKFNTQNTIQRQEYNNNVGNRATEQNWQGKQGIANQNTAAAYDHRQATMGVQQSTAAYNRDKAVDEYNRKQAEKAAKAKKKSGMMGAVGGAVGAVAGAYFGGPAGASAGYAVGSGLGSNMAHGGRVPGPEVYPYDTEENDIVPANLSPGEIVIPKTVAKDPVASAQFVANENAKSIDPSILDRLAQKNPDLISKYRARMSGADQEIKDAQKAQDMGTYANIAGDLLTNLSNSQKNDVIYKNRTADMGKAPTIQQAERKSYDPSLVNGVTGQAMSRAQLAKKDAEAGFWNEEKLTDLGQSRSDQELIRGDQARAREKAARLEDPNSDESKAARDYLLQVAPKATSLANFNNLSAAQVEKIAPGMYQAYNASEERKARADDRKAQREFQAGLRADAKADRQAAKNEAKTIKQAEADDKAVERLSKSISGVQDTANAIAKVEAKLGGKLDDFENVGGTLNKNGKAVDLPGVSIPGIGRISAYDGNARELESAIGTVFNTELKDRSGAAVTNNEMERLKKEFGSGKFNSEAEMIGALKDYKAAMLQELKDREAAFRPEVKEIYRERGGQTSDDFATPNSKQNERKPAPHGERVQQDGVTYVWNGSEYVEE